MRRRKQRNPLLMRIIIISVLAHVLLLPILAHYGAFTRVRQQFLVGEVQMVHLPPAQQDKPETKKQEKAKPQKPARMAKKANATTPHQQRSATRTNLNQPKLALAKGSGGGDAGGGSVEQGTGKAGEIPTPKADVTQPTVKTPDPQPQPKPEPKPEIKSEPKPEVKPEPQKQQIARLPDPKPEPKPEPKPAPHIPVFTEAAQTFAPQPSIPDDLRAAALDKTVVVEITVDENGSATNVKMMQSAGNDELDRIAADTARKWKFKPATRDGQPVESRVRLHIQFQVS